MYIVLISAIVVNILSVIMLLIGLFYNFKQPKNKAVYGYIIAGSLLFYVIILSIIAIYSLLINKILYSLLLILYIISPFIIGKLVRYTTLKKYTTAQIICCSVSLITLLLIV